MNRIVLLGKNGQLGYELENVLKSADEVFAFDRSELDISDLSALASKIKALQPTIIINAAAYTAVDKAEDDEINCFAANASAPAVMAREAKKLGALLIHFSTDYVFDGTKEDPYLETDTPNPINYYGYSKLMGENAIQHSGCSHLIFRTSWVYHPNYGANFYRTMTQLAKEREELSIVSDQRGVPNDARWLALQIKRMLQEPFEVLKQKSGIYHLSGENVMTWCDFARNIIDAIPADERKCSTIIPILTSQYPTPARRPMYSVMNTNKCKVAFGI